MDTPIKDFVDKYASSNAERLHMPGHKGVSNLGVEALDITEIDGADSLYTANGVIKKSQENASSIFNAHTFYSTEGSSLSIRAMLYLALKHSNNNQDAFVLAGRNAHKSFISAVGLLGLDVKWLYPKKSQNYLSCNIDAYDVEKTLSNLKQLPIALYLTSPDYLGNTLDIQSIKKVCNKFGVLLLVDNAHGSYLKFLPKSLHPIDLGADMCCDSAHKTLSALTGAGYLHLSKSLPDNLVELAPTALSLFGSTSPSYLILQSLDLANKSLADGYAKSLNEFIIQLDAFKEYLQSIGWTIVGDEKLKLSISTKEYGYYGYQVNEYLKSQNIILEFYDKDFIVAMFTPNNGKRAIDNLKKALSSLPKKQAIKEPSPVFECPEKVLTIRQALLSETEKIDVDNADGKIFADVCFSCPPAVPVVVCGERINKKAIECLKYYGVTECSVVKE